MQNKICRRCENEKPNTNKFFAKHYVRSDGSEVLKSECRVCHAQSSKAWRRSNPERNAATITAWRSANPERVIAVSKRWRSDNAEAIREYKRNRSPEQRSAENHRHYQSNPDTWRRASLRRKRLLVGAVQDDHTRTEILERDGWQCQLDDCRCPAGRAIDSNSTSIRWSATLDHRVPLSKGGDDTRDNVRAAHFACNSARGNR